LRFASQPNNEILAQVRASVNKFFSRKFFSRPRDVDFSTENADFVDPEIF